MRHRLETPFARPVSASFLLLGLLTLAGCSSTPSPTPIDPDAGPTLKSLAGRKVSVPVAVESTISEDQAIAAYRAMLAAGPTPSQRAEALRRIGDLEMDGSDRRAASPEAAASAANVDYRVAIERYQEYLAASPKDPGNDKVLYQLARAYEQGGDLDAALKSLDRLVKEYPATVYRDEAQFRRGELLFTARRYADAEAAYSQVLSGAAVSPYRERSLYMQGWAQYKRGQLEAALGSFLSVLDRRLAQQPDDVPIEQLPGLSRADRELVEDSFRVASLSFESLQGIATIPTYVQTQERRAYEPRIYQQLAALYQKQNRPKDAADAYAAFVKLNPSHSQAPAMQARVIEIYTEAGFDGQALEAKKDFVDRYGPGGEFRRVNPVAWEKSLPLLKTHLSELARYYHALWQKDRKASDVQEASKWYGILLTAFPDDVNAPRNRFLFAELLFEDKRYSEAAVQYELAAYQSPSDPKAADSAYAGLLARAEQVKLAAESERPALKRAGIASALRFAEKFGNDPRTASVLANAADTLYKLGEGPEAGRVAALLLALQPPATAELRRVGWTIQGQTAFESGNFALAEKSYGEVLAMIDAKASERKSLEERLAASIYQQGDAARKAGQTQLAADFFQRVVTVAPESSIRMNAQYDAAASYIALKDWANAVRLLEDFRQRYPRSDLQPEVNAKLAFAYSETASWSLAAGEFERVAAAAKDPLIARGAAWQAAELREKAAKTPAERQLAIQSWERYVKLYPAPLEPAVEARAKLLKFAQEAGPASKVLALQREILQVDQAGGKDRTVRTRFLGATAALALAEPVFASYKQVALIEPLQKQLKLKKSRLEEVLKAYALAADYGVAEVVTAATYQTANLYQDFGKALLTSERPKKLGKAELEQYTVLLEEQAFPFEEKAAELHTLNARRVREGLYDVWVQRSFVALKDLRPARFGKSERSAEVIDAIR